MKLSEWAGAAKTRQKKDRINVTFKFKLHLNLKSSIETKKLSKIKTLSKNFEKITSVENIEPLTLEIEASEGTWISLAIDNLDTQDFRISADEIQQWVAKKHFLLTIGNTKVVRVLLNGREIETDRTNDLLLDWYVDYSFLP